LNTEGVERTLEAVVASPGSPSVIVIHPWELVDPPPGPVPAWMRTGCSSDPTKLDAFLGRLRQEDVVSTFEAELDRLRLPVEWREGDAESGRGISVFLVTNVYKPVIGGITSYVANLERCLRDRFRVQVLAYPRFLVELEARYPRHPLRRVVHIAFGLLVFAAILRERLRGRRVVVHSHSASFCLAVGYLGRLLGARAVHTFHSPLAYRSLTLEGLSRRLDALVFVSAAVRANYADVTGTWNDFEASLPGALDLAPPPTDDARALLRAEVARRWGVPRDAFLAVFAGRVVPDKGVHVLAEAASLLGPSDGYVLVAGPRGRTEADRAYADRLPTLAGEAGASGRFRCLGALSQEQLEDLFRACDVVVVPSVWAEPAPMVAIEAMAHGHPVVASSVGGLPFLVPDGQAGLLVPPQDPRALAEALRRLAHDASLRERLGSQARKQAERRHALTRFAVEHARLYSSL
ncbi:MAG: glycosyltransferase family 4 protein, partial [Euryarchaeota archaeon]|nr:glycosyltransferase family 4 protein [Euryarchaeota archaeon]